MAPIHRSDILGMDVSSLELDVRSTPSFDLANYLSSLELSEREALMLPPNLNLPKRTPVFERDILNLPPTSSVSKRSSTSPLEDYSQLRARDPAQTKSVSYGHGAIDPNHINMKGFFALFAFIGAALVLTAIWFFFWAKNGGFHWRRGDWDDYKSTVLRRKGPNGTTLSGATESTVLGGGSVVGVGYRDDDGSSAGMSEEMVEVKLKAKNKASKAKAAGGRGPKGQEKQERLRQQRNEVYEGGADDDVRAYRHEKPAKVGGLNRVPDGSYHGSSTNPSEWSHSQTHRQPSPHKSRQPGHRDPSSSNYSFTAGSETTFTNTSEDRRPLRSQNRTSHPQPPRYHSPQKKPTRTSMPGSYADPIDFSNEYTGSGNESNGTKSYYHPIAGLSPGAKNVGGPRGFRRDGGRRRDSLSESEGEDSRR